MSSEQEKAEYWAARRGCTSGRQGERRAAASRAQHVPADQKTERRKRIEARWALRKREAGRRSKAVTP